MGITLRVNRPNFGPSLTLFSLPDTIICIAATDASPAATNALAEADRAIAAEKEAREELGKCHKRALAKRP